MYSFWCGLFILSMSSYPSVLTFPTVGIIDGANTTIEHHPWLVSVWRASPTPALFCAGFLISDSFVVTTASCLIYNVSYIRAGSTNCQSEGVTARIEEKILHPSFDLGTLDSDIAIIRLETPVAGDNIQPIPLPDKNVSIASGDPFVVAGWGKTTTTDLTNSETLHEVEIQAITAEDCKKTFGTFITENKICGEGVGATGPYTGDEGDPVLWNGQPVGLVSYMFYVNGMNYPATFTNVINFVGWIQKVTEDF